MLNEKNNGYNGWNIFGDDDGGCETVMRESGEWLASLDDVSENDRTVKFSYEYYNGKYIVTVDAPNGDEFAFTASDYNDMFYYMEKICERIRAYFVGYYNGNHRKWPVGIDFNVNGYLKINYR